MESQIQTCPCLETKQSQSGTIDKCLLDGSLVDGDDYYDFAASCTKLMMLNNPNQLDRDEIESFDCDYIPKAIKFYKSLN